MQEREAGLRHVHDRQALPRRGVGATGLGTAAGSQAGLTPRLTLHAIDNFPGTPGAGMVCDLALHDGDGYRLIKTVTTAPNGRTAEPLLVDEAFKPGRYELVMHVEAYFAGLG